MRKIPVDDIEENMHLVVHSANPIKIQSCEYEGQIQKTYRHPVVSGNQIMRVLAVDLPMLVVHNLSVNAVYPLDTRLLNFASPSEKYIKLLSQVITEAPQVPNCEDQPDGIINEEE